MALLVNFYLKVMHREAIKKIRSLRYSQWTAQFGNKRFIWFFCLSEKLQWHTPLTTWFPKQFERLTQA